MTAIVGIVHNTRVLLGGDSAGVCGYQLTVRKDPKVFTNGAYVFGYTDSFRMGQLLRWSFKPPTPPRGADVHEFLATTWVEALRECLKDGGWARKDMEQERGGVFLIGYRGRLFEVFSDYQVGESADGYAAAGCGEEVVLGALHATAALPLDPEVRATMALAAAERHSAGVRGPFILAWEPGRVVKAAGARRKAA